MSALADIAKVTLWERNYNEGDVGAIAASIQRFGFNGALRLWKGTCVAGNHQVLALRRLKEQGAPPPHNVTVRRTRWFVPTISINHLSKLEAEAFGAADNRTRDLASTNDQLLATILQEIAQSDAELLRAAGYDDDDLDQLLRRIADADGEAAARVQAAESAGKLSARFLVPPFSVLNSREGWWQERKGAWLGLGIQSEVGRGEETAARGPGGGGTGAWLRTGAGAKGQRLGRKRAAQG